MQSLCHMSTCFAPELLSGDCFCWANCVGQWMSAWQQIAVKQQRWRKWSLFLPEGNFGAFGLVDSLASGAHGSDTRVWLHLNDLGNFLDCSQRTLKAGFCYWVLTEAQTVLLLAALQHQHYSCLDISSSSSSSVPLWGTAFLPVKCHETWKYCCSWLCVTQCWDHSHSRFWSRSSRSGTLKKRSVACEGWIYQRLQSRSQQQKLGNTSLSP